MAEIFGHGFSRGESNDAARLEDGLLNLVEMSDPLPPCRGLQFRLRDHLFDQLVILNLAVMNQLSRFALGHTLELWMAKQESHDNEIDQ